jgi:hypothetical protein
LQTLRQWLEAFSNETARVSRRPQNLGACLRDDDVDVQRNADSIEPEKVLLVMSAL